MTRLVLVAVIVAGLLASCGGDRTLPTIDITSTTAPDPIAAALAIGLDVYTAQCQTCHGIGDETELAPSMHTDVLDTFGSCADQIEFVTIGGDQWPGDTYGDDASPLGKYELIMAGYGSVLSSEEIAAVNFWIRVELAGVDEATAAEDCGIGE